MIICEESEEVIATYFGKGKTHDYKLYEESRVRLSKAVGMKADSGYQGIQRKHAKVLLPKKNSKLKKLTKEEKKANRELSSKRIKVVKRKAHIFLKLSIAFDNDIALP